MNMRHVITIKKEKEILIINSGETNFGLLM